MLDAGYVKECIKLSDIVKEHVELKKSGSSSTRWIGLCPFHQERTPSFCVSDDRGYFRCFGCGAKGDVFSFLQQINGVDFKEAIGHCKQVAGIRDEYLSPEQKKIYEAQAKRRAAESADFKKWRLGLVESLICYTNAVWRNYRKARREGEEGDEFFIEASAKEKALGDLENMPEKDLMEYYRTQKSWVGAMNPPWFLSGKRLAIAKEERGRSSA